MYNSRSRRRVRWEDLHLLLYITIPGFNLNIKIKKISVDLTYISLQCELTPINLWWNALIYSSFHFDALCFSLMSFLKNLNVLLSHFVSRSQKFKLPCLQLSPMYAYADSFYFCSNVLFCFFALTRI